MNEEYYVDLVAQILIGEIGYEQIEKISTYKPGKTRQDLSLAILLGQARELSPFEKKFDAIVKDISEIVEIR